MTYRPFATGGALLLAALLSILPGCFEEGTASGETTPRREAPVRVPVRIFEARRGRIEETITGTAAIEARSWVDVHPETAGRVKAIGTDPEGNELRETSIVTPGTLLLLLEDDEARHRLRRARAILEQKKRLLERQERLFSRNLIPEDDVSTARFEAKMAALDEEEARLALERTRITAPIAGTITFRDVRVGERVDPSRNLFTIIDLSSLVAILHLPARERSRIRPGMPCRIRKEGQPAARGRVDLVHPTTDPRTGTVKVEIAIDPGTPHDLHWGDFVEVEVVRAVHEGETLVPKESVVEGSAGPSCFILQGETARLVPIVIRASDTRFHAVAGIEPGTQVIVEGQTEIADGMLVDVVE